jgi:hypothetical protein
MAWLPKRRVHKWKERKDSIGRSVGKETVWSAGTLERTGPIEAIRSRASWRGGWTGRVVRGEEKLHAPQALPIRFKNVQSCDLATDQTFLKEAKRCLAFPSRAEPSRAEPSRAEPSRAEPSRASPSRAEPSRAKPSLA